ncbi:MAG: hypothetical protein SNJ72_00020 [Fimbriimonadales bacterium]
MDKQKQTILAVAVVVLVIVVLAVFFLFMGGGGGQDTATTSPPMSNVDMDRDGGMPPAPMGGPPMGGPSPMGGPAMMGQPSSATPPPAQQQTAQVPFKPRRDPFAYLPEENEALQADAFDPNRYFVLASPPRPPRVELPEPFEPQPRRRISGIVIGTTVSAILEQEGEIPQIIQPGDTVGEFRVAAITPEGAILRRSRGNPREVFVRYEPPSAGGVGGGGRAGGFAPGAPGGAPSAPGAAGAGGVGGGRGGRGAAPGL